MTRQPTGDKIFDVAIIGGGPAGCSLAALLGQQGIDTLCLDRESLDHSATERFDGRTTAISFGSRNVLLAAGVWDRLEPLACPITHIDITESGKPSMLEFLSKDVDAPAFGWVIENRHLRRGLYDRLAQLADVSHRGSASAERLEIGNDHATVTTTDGTAHRARLVVGADGRQSFTRNALGIGTRSKEYGQRAVVCLVQHEHPHEFRAVEDFRAAGPLAILPMTDDAEGRYRSAVVWTEDAAGASAAAWDDAAFEAALTERFPARYGRIELAGPRYSYPLGLVHAQSYIGPRTALIADAAHAIHPIAGQGLNMGLRDVAALAELLAETNKSNVDPGARALLEQYQRARHADTMLMIGATDTLNGLFSNGSRPLAWARQTGLKAVAHISPVRRFFMSQAMGKSGLLPALVRTGKLPQ